jgi:hypothetical protein
MTTLQLFMTDLLVDKRDVVLISDTAKVSAAKNGSEPKKLIRTSSCPFFRSSEEQERWGNPKGSIHQVHIGRDRTPSKSSNDRSSSSSPTRPHSWQVAPKKTSILENKRNSPTNETEKSKSLRKTSMYVKTVHINNVSKKSRDSPTNQQQDLSKQTNSEQLKAQSIVSLVQALALKATVTIYTKTKEDAIGDNHLNKQGRVGSSSVAVTPKASIY